MYYYGKERRKIIKKKEYEKIKEDRLLKINENIAYIKLKIEIGNFGEETVCLSFHKSYRR